MVKLHICAILPLKGSRKNHCYQVNFLTSKKGSLRIFQYLTSFFTFLGGYTVVLYSEGMARDHQSACLGIYRSSSYLNGRPVYKQDDGENYLYYHKSENSWLVGPHVGNNYAWVRNQLDQSMSSSSTSSSDDSDSDSDDSVASNSDHSIGSSGKVEIV